jgi:septal ring factor EnvC (AmiA/AmiB activator)
MRVKLKLFICILMSLNSRAETSGTTKAGLNQKLDQVRSQRLAVEKALIDAEKSKRSTEEQLKRLKTLQRLQNQEKTLTEERLKTLEKYLKDLQTRKEEVEKRIDTSQISLKLKFSKLIHPLLSQNEQLLKGDEGEGARRLKEKIISGVALSDLKELEVLYADLQDAEDIESRIEQEKQQINSLMQDISEQESLIRFHKKIREELTDDKHEEHLRQLEEYQKLKVSEVEIGKMISEFQDHQKLEQAHDQKKKAPFFSFKPKSLPWPLRGKVVETYGQHRDSVTGLNIFKKGIEILTMSDNAPVVSVLDGKVQFSGEIPGKGKVVILEHLHSIYSIYGGLKGVLKSAGEAVKASEKVGVVESEKPLYFEIRARNVAIDPIKWLQ